VENMRRIGYTSPMLFWVPFLAAFVLTSTTNGALLFQDRHAGANGGETVYRFEANAASTTSPIEQSKAVKVATVWAAQYYGISSLSVTNAQERMMPIRYWLIAFAAPSQSKGGTYYSIVLPNGSVVDPKVSRQNFTASVGPVDVTKDTELQAPVKGLEVHGEIVFEYGWGKGLRCDGLYAPYVPGPVWDGPPAPVRPAP
jgi:hypothetical protein